MLSRRTILLGLLLVLLAGGMLASAQGDVSWRVESATPLPLPEGVRTIFPAPDGRQVAYDNGEWEVCALDVTTEQERCVGIPREVRLIVRPDEFYPGLAWSPDGNRAAVVGLPYRHLDDSDLTVVDFATGQILNMVNDGYEGNLIGDEASGAIIDIQPAWSLDGSLLAFERVVLGEDGFGRAMITVVDTATGEARSLAQLPNPLDEDFVDAGNTVGLAWSPDGSRDCTIFCVNGVE